MFQQETKTSEVCAKISCIPPDALLFFTLLYLDYFVIQDTTMVLGFDFPISNHLTDPKFGVKLEDRKKISILIILKLCL